MKKLILQGLGLFFGCFITSAAVHPPPCEGALCNAQPPLTAPAVDVGAPDAGVADEVPHG